MKNDVKYLIRGCLGLVLPSLLVGCERSPKNQAGSARETSSDGIVIVNIGGPAEESDYDPAFIEAYGAALSEGNYALAEQLTKDLVSKRPKDANAQVGLGLTQLMQGQFENAIVSFDQAIKIAPDNTDALYNRGFASWQLDDSNTAMSYYRRALKVDSELAEAHYGMAATSEVLGMNELVVEHASRFLELKANDPFAPDARVMLKSAKESLEGDR